MNRYYEKEQNHFSGFGTFRVEGTAVKRTGLTESVVRLLSWISKKLSTEKARRIEKVAAACLMLFGLIGVIGAMESGALPLFSGFLIGVGLIGLEFRLLRTRKRGKDQT